MRVLDQRPDSVESSEVSMIVSMNVKEIVIPLVLGRRVIVGEILQLDCPRGSHMSKVCGRCW